MNKTSVNTALLTIGTGLVAVGATTILTNLLYGAVEIVLGVIVYVVYEKFPS